MSDDNWEHITFNDYDEYPEIQLMNNLELKECYLDNIKLKHDMIIESEKGLIIESEKGLIIESEKRLKNDMIIESQKELINVETLLAEVERDEDIEVFLNELADIKLKDIMNFPLSIVDFIMNHPIPYDHYNYDNYDYNYE